VREDVVSTSSGRKTDSSRRGRAPSRSNSIRRRTTCCGSSSAGFGPVWAPAIIRVRDMFPIVNLRRRMHRAGGARAGGSAVDRPVRDADASGLMDILRPGTVCLRGAIAAVAACSPPPRCRCAGEWRRTRRRTACVAAQAKRGIRQHDGARWALLEPGARRARRRRRNALGYRLAQGLRRVPADPAHGGTLVPARRRPGICEAQHNLDDAGSRHRSGARPGRGVRLRRAAAQRGTDGRRDTPWVP